MISDRPIHDTNRCTCGRWSSGRRMLSCACVQRRGDRRPTAVEIPYDLLMAKGSRANEAGSDSAPLVMSVLRVDSSKRLAHPKVTKRTCWISLTARKGIPACAVRSVSWAAQVHPVHCVFQCLAVRRKRVALPCKPLVWARAHEATAEGNDCQLHLDNLRCF